MRSFTLLSLVVIAASISVSAPTSRPTPPLVFKNARGGPDLALSQFKGKIVALALTSTTCEHCQMLTHLLNKVQDDYQKKNVVVVECAFNDNVQMTLGPFMKDVAPKFAMGYTSNDAILKFLNWNEKKDGILYVPYMLFIDAKGVIRFEEKGRDGFFVNADQSVRKVLDQMTGGAPAAPAAKKK